MKKSNLVFYSVMSIFLLVLSGCASKPTTADLMRGHAAELQEEVDLRNQFAKEWEKGTKLISSGEKRVDDGEKRVKSAERDLKSAQRDLKEGQADIKNGTRDIAEGQRLVRESERKFRENFPEPVIKPVIKSSK